MIDSKNIIMGNNHMTTGDIHMMDSKYVAKDISYLCDDFFVKVDNSHMTIST